MAEYVSFGAWLKQRRTALDLTQAELARQLGCATVTLQKIELDERRPSKELAVALAEQLAVPADERAAFVQAARGARASERLPVALPPAIAPPWQPAPRPRHNLPAQTTSFIGREAEVRDVCTLLRRSDVRLLTLTGPGGTGKTRLSHQVAADVLDDFADAAWFVDLAPISDPALVTSAIATVLGTQEVGGRPLHESLAASLAEKQLLLVLDNFEQVLPAAPLVAALLQAAPRLKVLITSRAVLRLRGEREFPVSPLALPDPHELPSLERLRQYEAVALFIVRAQDVKPDFQVTNANALAIAEICSRLDGLPLAIELAAARVKVLPPAALLARLEHRLQVLTGGARDLDARQQTLRGTIDWSYQLLTAEEQTIFARLGLFVGGCTLEAAEALCNAAGDFDVLDAVASLVDKSLVRQTEAVDDEPRFTMLETIREYALERLEASGGSEALRQRHALYYVGLAETAESALRGLEQQAWLKRLEVEHDNLRAAWSQTEQDPGEQSTETGLRLVGALWQFWLIRGYWDEWERWFTWAQTHAGVSHGPLLAKVLLGRGMFMVSLYGPDEAAALGAESLALYQAIEDQRGIAASLIVLGFGTAYQGKLVQGSTWLADGLARARAVGDPWLVTWALLCQGEVAASRYGDYAQAQAPYEESVALAREIGDQRLVARALGGLGFVRHVHGDHQQAMALLEEGLAIERGLGNKQGITTSLFWLGLVSLNRRDYARARAVNEERLRIEQELGNTGSIMHVLGTLGQVALAQGDFVQAQAHFEQSLALGRAAGDRLSLYIPLACLGHVALAKGDDAQAQAYYQESLTILREEGDLQDTIWVLLSLGHVAVARGKYLEARSLYHESLLHCRELGHRQPISPCLAGLARVARGQGRPEQAARLWGAFEALRQVPGATSYMLDHTQYDRDVEDSRTQMDDPAWADGRAMTLEQAIAYAVEDTG